MKPPHSSDETSKFNGNLRHYHRAGGHTQRSWDDWVEGTTAKVRKPRNWLKIVGIIVGVLVLSGIVTGLVIELS